MCSQPAKRMRMTPPDNLQQQQQQQQQQSDENNDELRSHIARLASELESLKTLMLGSNGPSSSGRARNNSNSNNNNNYRLH